MKKISIILAAAAVALSAQAETSSLRHTLAVKKPTQKAFIQQPTLLNATENKAVKEVRKASNPTIDELAGSWTFPVGDMFFEDSAFDFIPVDYTATIDGDTILFKSSDSNFLSLKATYNQTTGQISFPICYIGINEGYHIYQSPFLYDYTVDDLVLKDELVTDYDPAIGITIAAAPDMGIAFRAFQGKNYAGYNNLFFLQSAEYNDAVIVDEGNWTDIGNATFMDGWLLPAFGIDQAANQYEVPLQRNADSPNLYRLVNPYKYGPIAEYNEWNRNGYIVFDVSDPDHVVFKQSIAGFSSAIDGIVTFYCYNQLGMLAANYPQYSIQQIVGMQEGYTPWTTFKDGIVTLSRIDRNLAGKLVYDANYGTQYLTTGGGVWANQQGTVVNMLARILFPGADGVAGVEAEENAPVEYFNLQGLRVVSPEAGSLVIKRQGCKTSKVLVK